MNRRRMAIRRREAEGRMWVRFGREIAVTKLQTIISAEAAA